MWLLACAAAVAGRQAGLLQWQRQFPTMEACAAEATLPYEEVSGVLGTAREAVLAQMESTHFVALLPASAAFATGEASVSAAAYASLPMAAGKGPYTTALTKVVLVAHSDEATGLSLADCGLSDAAAADWLRGTAGSMVNGLALNAGTASAASLGNQLPFLNLVFEGQLTGNVLPLVLGDQTAQTAQQVANLLKTLVSKGGPYKHERVLFVFAGDLSRDLAKKWAIPRDAETVEKAVASGFGEMAVYFDKLKEVQAADEHRRPYDFAVVLAAVKLASDLGLTGSTIRVSNSGDFIGAVDRNEDDKVRGYAAVLYGKDERPLGQRLSSGPQKAKTAAPTTSTTTIAPTIQPPPTIIPVDQQHLIPSFTQVHTTARLRHR